MARPYRDGVEVITEPVDPKVWTMTPEGAQVVLGVAYPGVIPPVPIVLIPGYEYRLREWTDDARPGEVCWTLERRRAAGVRD